VVSWLLQVQLGKSTSSTDYCDRAALPGGPLSPTAARGAAAASAGIAAAPAAAPPDYAAAASYGGLDGACGAGALEVGGIGAYAGSSSLASAGLGGNNRTGTAALDEDPDSLL
jgi:hypothetical protein